MKRPLSPLLIQTVRNAAIFFVTVLLVVLIRILSFSSAAEEDNKKSYLDIANEEDAGDSVDPILNEYHNTINNYFNERIERLARLANPRTGEGETLDENLKRLAQLVTPPGFDIDPTTKQPTRRRPCISEGANVNLSTYCLSQIAVPEYFKFREAMLRAREKAKYDLRAYYQAQEKKGQTAQLNDRALEKPDFFKAINPFAPNGFEGYGALVERIDREIDIARQTLDKTLATYNELQLALPLHTKYKQIITALEKYRDAAAKVRDQIEVYPSTFLDVTTTSCT